MPALAVVLDTGRESAELDQGRIAPSQLSSSTLAPIAASPMPSAIASVVGESSLESVMGDDLTPAREVSDIVEVRGASRGMERLPTPTPSVPVTVAFFDVVSCEYGIGIFQSAYPSVSIKSRGG